MIKYFIIYMTVRLLNEERNHLDDNKRLTITDFKLTKYLNTGKRQGWSKSSFNLLMYYSNISHDCFGSSSKHCDYRPTCFKVLVHFVDHWLILSLMCRSSKILICFFIVIWTWIGIFVLTVTKITSKRKRQ